MNNYNCLLLDGVAVIEIVAVHGTLKLRVGVCPLKDLFHDLLNVTIMSAMAVGEVVDNNSILPLVNPIDCL